MILKDILSIKGGKRLPKGVMLTSTPNNHPYIRIRDMKSRFLTLDNYYEYVPDDQISTIKNYIVNTNDLIISIVGTIGLVGIIDNSLDNANLTENCVKLINIKHYNVKYLYYFFISNYGQKQIEQCIVGSTQPKLPIYNIEQIEIPNISLEYQQHIVDTTVIPHYLILK